MEAFNNTTVQMAGPTENIKDVLTGTYAAICTVGLVMNIILISTILTSRRLRTIPNIYLLNLAIADQLFLIGIPFFATNIYKETWPFGHIVCKIVLSSDTTTMFTSIFCLTAMSADRCIAAALPLKSRRCRTVKTSAVINGFMWVLGLAVSSPVIAFATTETIPSTGQTFCNIYWPEPIEIWAVSFVLYSTFVGFVLPFIVVLVCSIVLVCVYRSSVGNRYGRRMQKQLTLSCVVYGMVILFALSWLPFYIFQILNMTQQFLMTPENSWIPYSAVILSYSNSVFNPVISIILNKQCRQYMRDTIRRSLHRHIALRKFTRRGTKRSHVSIALQATRTPTIGHSPEISSFFGRRRSRPANPIINGDLDIQETNFLSPSMCNMPISASRRISVENNTSKKTVGSI
ncbi:somatostatin receptor type 5-like [Branchiostoma floridae]|uniref:Somatostatin receptor type 5-like n=2 Tax=Branchiostoma floridae TaxID=7739 RepID=A0A9J7MLD0_BRAFL|nr:somatostatin receptor type 5-like [Branchiostoma floridae]